MTALVTYQLDHGIATLTMDDGKANAISLPMLAELNAALDRAAADKAGVILTGRTGTFSGGFDLPTLMSRKPAALDMVLGGFQLAERLLSNPKPVVIACNGHAIAMGAFLLLTGDYRIGTEGAFKITANEVALGLTMPHSATEICRQRLTPAHFQRTVINAEIYSPADAVTAGFLDRLVPAAELADAARSAAAQLGKLNQPAHAATKLRARKLALHALREAMEADRADLQALGARP